MPSPFPGMDPYIENQRWSGFHLQFIAELAAILVPQVRPRYEVDPDRRIYVERVIDEPQLIIPDLAISAPAVPDSSQSSETAEAAFELKPLVVTLPMPEEQREAFLTIRDRVSHEVVTVIEVLSPGNKRRGSDGRAEYLDKRVSVLQSRTHLVELDLLRGGTRLPTVEPLEPADYYAFVCRRGNRPRAVVQRWTLRQPLPSIPIPLANGDPDVSLICRPLSLPYMIGPVTITRSTMNDG